MRSLILLLIMIPCLAHAHNDKKNGLYEYYKHTLTLPAHPLLVDNFTNLDLKENSVALELGSGMGNETLFLLQKGLDVIAVDEQESALETILHRAQDTQYKDHLRTIKSSFENLDFSELPKVDLVISNFAISFCKPEKFGTFFKEVTNQIKKGGYFLGTFFDAKSELFKGAQRQKMVFHTQKDVEKLFQGWKIIKLDLVKRLHRNKIDTNYYYNVIAQKP